MAVVDPDTPGATLDVEIDDPFACADTLAIHRLPVPQLTTPAEQLDGVYVAAYEVVFKQRLPDNVPPLGQLYVVIDATVSLPSTHGEQSVFDQLPEE